MIFALEAYVKTRNSFSVHDIWAHPEYLSQRSLRAMGTSLGLVLENLVLPILKSNSLSYIMQLCKLIEIRESARYASFVVYLLILSIISDSRELKNLFP